jgi:hypothetical protein
VTLSYFHSVPEEVPTGRIVVHNHIRARAQLGLGGFRAWSDLPGPQYVECRCRWAPHLGRHYRVKRERRSEQQSSST